MRGEDIRATLRCTRASEGMDKASQRIKDKDIIQTNMTAHKGRCWEDEQASQRIKDKDIIQTNITAHTGRC